MLIEKVSSLKNRLRGQSAIITGAGGGIGFETAKALCYLGARVEIVEIDKEKGQRAEREINAMFGSGSSEYYYLDLGSEEEIHSFVGLYTEKHGCPDIIINNAADVIIGAMDKLSSEDWDRGYRVNLKAPILLTMEFIAGMKIRNSGTICFVPSSGAAPYMGAYEVFKTAQVEVCTTLCGEIEGTDVFAYSIAPGLVKTETADKAIEKLAAMMGIAKESVYSSNEKNMLTSEEAGTAFALSVLAADKYHGLEIGSIQVLNDYKLLDLRTSDSKELAINEESAIIIQTILSTFKEQREGWNDRNIFERQWLLRDFKKQVGYSSEQMELNLIRIYNKAKNEGLIEKDEAQDVLKKLGKYYANQYKLLQGWEKNPEKLLANSKIIKGWMYDTDSIIKILSV